MHVLHRRGFLAAAGMLSARFSFLRAIEAVANERSYAEEMPDMLLHYLEERLNALAERWDRARAGIRTAEDVKARDHFVRTTLLQMIGKLPDKTPLNPILAGVLERDGYRIEKLMFESRPNFWVTSLLYVPTSRHDPFPGIISPSGHLPDAGRSPAYQFAHADLVKSGFVVLAYDPVGQGERRHFWDPQTRQLQFPTTNFEHSMFGQLLLLLGENMTQYRLWDGFRALDYLETRPEVDKTRIGCAGHSGGAYMTMLIAALDQRVKCAAVIESGQREHRWPVNLLASVPVHNPDAEHHLLPAALHGIDYCDVLQAIAPRPLLMAKEYFSDAKFTLAAKHVRGRYQILGVPDRFATAEAGDVHAWTMKLRLAAADWFCRWFYNRRGPLQEPESEPEPVERLYCTPNGSLRYSKQGETIHTLIQKKLATLPPGRTAPQSPVKLAAYQEEVRTKVAELLRYQPGKAFLAVRHVVTTPRRGYRVEQMQFLSEPGIYIPAWVFIPASLKKARAPIVYAGQTGMQQLPIVGEFGLLANVVRKGHMVVAVDVRGIGETEPLRPPQLREQPFGQLFDIQTAMAFIAWAMDSSLLGMRVLDVMRTVDYVLSRPDVDGTGVKIVGVGMGALWALFAAALDSRIRTVVADGGLLSYRTLASADRYVHGADVFVPHILEQFDLPQIAAAIADRSLALLAPVDHMRKPVEVAAAESEYRFTREAYDAAGAPGRFHIAERQADPAEQYLSLLGSSA